MKIRYQVMLEEKLLAYLKEKQRHYSHHNLSITINAIIKQTQILEDTYKKEIDKASKKDVDKVKKQNVLDTLHDKYKIGE
jgi:hypothetical protein